jgi:hypothetical protein
MVVQDLWLTDDDDCPELEDLLAIRASGSACLQSGCVSCIAVRAFGTGRARDH